MRKILSALVLLFILSALVPYSAFVYAGINDGLVSYWKFDEGTPNTCAGSEDVCDSTTTGVNGERAGASGTNNLPQWSSDTVPTIAAPNPYSMNFDGTDDQVTGIGDFDFPSNAFSAVAWIRPHAWGDADNQYIADLLCDEGGASTFCFRLGSLGLNSLKQKIAVMIYTNTSNDFESTTDLSLDTWTHVAVTFDGSNVRFYINGVLDRTQTANITMNNGSGGFRMGAAPDNHRFYNGYMDELRIYNRAITFDEINELAANNPGIYSLSPSDDDTNAQSLTNLVLTFDRTVTAVSSKYIYVKQAWNNSIIETIAATDTSKVYVSGSTVTVNPATVFTDSAQYYILIDSGAFIDTYENIYNGMSESTNWNFTIRSSVPEFPQMLLFVVMGLMVIYITKKTQVAAFD